MTGYDWLDVLIGIGVALLITWLLFIAALAIGRPKGSMLTESLRLLPDLLRLLRRIAADKHQATGVRVRLVLLLAYLAFYADRRHPREVLSELLWPDEERDATRARATVTSWSCRASSLPRN